MLQTGDGTEAPSLDLLQTPRPGVRGISLFDNPGLSLVVPCVGALTTEPDPQKGVQEARRNLRRQGSGSPGLSRFAQPQMVHEARYGESLALQEPALISAGEYPICLWHTVLHNPAHKRNA